MRLIILAGSVVLALSGLLAGCGTTVTPSDY